MTEAGHTPWHVNIKYGPDGEENYAWVVADDGTLIGTFKTHHAEVVVRAVNSHAAMFEALKVAELGIEELCHGQHPDNECWNTLRTVRAALSQATGKE